jgi:hypothetical protein
MSRVLHLHNGSREKKPVPGLMIGRFGIQYIDLDLNKRPKKFDEVSFVNGDDSEEVKEGLGILSKKYKFKKVNLVIPEFEVSTFYITIYIEKNQKEREVVLDYIQKNTQMDPKDIVLDYDVLSHMDGVLIASVIVMSKLRYEWYMDILKSSKISFVRIISENIALAKALVKEDNNEPHMIVNIQPQYTTLSIAGDNVVYKTSVIDECIDNANILRISKKINSFMLDWYSQIGRVVHDRTHHVVVNTYSQELTKGVVSKLRNTLNHINVRKGSGWDNCFSLDEYIPEIHKKDLYRYTPAIGGALCGRK